MQAAAAPAPLYSLDFQASSYEGAGNPHLAETTLSVRNRRPVLEAI